MRVFPPAYRKSLSELEHPIEFALYKFGKRFNVIPDGASWAAPENAPRIFAEFRKELLATAASRLRTDHVAASRASAVGDSVARIHDSPSVPSGGVVREEEPLERDHPRMLELAAAVYRLSMRVFIQKYLGGLRKDPPAPMSLGSVLFWTKIPWALFEKELTQLRTEAGGDAVL